MENGTVTPATPAELDKRIADVIQNIEQDVDDDFNDADENDPDLLAELAQITGATKATEATESDSQRDTRSPVVVLPTELLGKIQILKSRLEMYELAEKAANEAGESTRTRRFTRGIQTINELMTKALSGDDINVENIPPEVSMKNIQQQESVETGEEAQED